MRLSKDVNGVTRNYLYNNGLLMQEIVDNTRILDYSYDSAGNPVSVAYRTSLSATPIYYYYAVNSRSDVVGIYTASGSLLVVYEYDAWGNILSVKNANGVNIANPNSIANIQSLRYRGYCYDTDTGLYYLQSRYYDPVTHRLINADGLVSTGTGVLDLNLFIYSENNPVIFSDPKGDRAYPYNFIGPLAPGDIRLGLDGVEIGGKGKTSSRPVVSDEYTVNYDYKNHGTIVYEFNSIRGTFFGVTQAPLYYKKLNHEALQKLYDYGMEKISQDAEAQLWGETLLHAYGYMVWDFTGYTQVLTSNNPVLGTIVPYTRDFFIQAL